ncbi:MAG TPA: hypothetical protein VHK65_16185 [Candidatus Dormibacteraeota bacterium]|nr:hypothetical protein [Candidatus Dormibacteraeota bacterium]
MRSLRLLEDLVGLDLEAMLSVSRVDVSCADFDDYLPIVPLVARKDFAPNARIDGKYSCLRNCLARENGRLVYEHPRSAQGISDPSFDPSRLWLIGHPAG